MFGELTNAYYPTGAEFASTSTLYNYRHLIMGISTLFEIFLLFKQENLYNREPEQPFPDLFGLGILGETLNYGGDSLPKRCALAQT